MISLICMCAALGAAPGEAFSVSARLDTASIAVGNKYEIVLDWSVGEGLSSDGAGVPAPILQIDVPRGVTLSGKVLKKYGDLAQNEFLQAPYARLLKESPARIEFKLRKELTDGDKIGLNILAYVGSSESGEVTFVRRRLELEVAPNATATTAEPTTSKWGIGKRLHIGDKAAGFSLPQADGTKVALKDYLGKKNIIVTTYRAFW